MKTFCATWEPETEPIVTLVKRIKHRSIDMLRLEREEFRTMVVSGSITPGVRFHRTTLKEMI